MVSRAAAPRLRQHVLGYCGYEEETVGFTRRRELPSGEVIVIIGFGPELETTYPGQAPGRVATLRTFVAGLHGMVPRGTRSGSALRWWRGRAR
jgi:hypothetical protein